MIIIYDITSNIIFIFFDFEQQIFFDYYNYNNLFIFKNFIKSCCESKFSLNFFYSNNNDQKISVKFDQINYKNFSKYIIFNVVVYK